MKDFEVLGADFLGRLVLQMTAGLKHSHGKFLDIKLGYRSQFFTGALVLFRTGGRTENQSI